MSGEKPILVLQMQRMGDLVLSYPLFGWLSAAFPDLPIWVVGERLFFQGLNDISPAVTYFDYSAAERLKSREYSLVLNLSHRREAAALAGVLKSGQRLGPYMPAGEKSLRIAGNWQLYRASVTRNNRHNLFHWADLNALDLIPLRQMRRTIWPQPKAPSGSGQVGLFVGASEPEKRPDPPFWALLADKLLRLGLRPVFLGGQKDAPVASKAAALLKMPALNLCGRFSISELCLFMQELDLLIAPDTGPMHIAAWLGLPVLNLSLGPVNAWETGPCPPGHHALRRALSCVGCWQCGKSSILCKNGFSATRAAELASLTLQEPDEDSLEADSGGYEIFKTSRDVYGLYDLRPLRQSGYSRLERSRFWKQFFLLALEKIPPTSDSLIALRQQGRSWREQEGLRSALLRQGQKLLRAFALSLRTGLTDDLAGEEFWLSRPPLLRPLSGYLQMMLQNDDFSRHALQKGIRLTEFFVSQFER